ncbi:MAG: hypothetical protein IBJ18_03770 [Phycisphaerales bacterium]|nr:hypothetical protein [Phycisphaerales bacterium]
MCSDDDDKKQKSTDSEDATPKRVEMAFEVLQHLNSTETKSFFSEGRELSKQEQRIRTLALRVIGQYIAGEMEYVDSVRPNGQSVCGVDPNSGVGKIDAIGDRQHGAG